MTDREQERVRVRVYTVYVCVCVWEREREREREDGGGKKRYLHGTMKKNKINEGWIVNRLSAAWEVINY